MSLQDIRSKLYKKEEETRREKTLKAWNKEEEKTEEILENKKEWVPSSKSLNEGVKRMLKILGAVIGGVALFLTIFWGILEYRKGSFSQDNIFVSWQGPKETKSGELVEYTLFWENKNRADLQNAFLRVKFPDNFKWQSIDNLEMGENKIATLNLGNIKGKSKGEIKISGKIYSPKGAFVHLNARLEYKPENVSSSFSKENQIGIMSTSAPIVFELSAPKGVSDGGVMRYEIFYKNNQQIDFSNLRLRASYPQGFSFSSSSIVSSNEGKFWNIGDLKAGQEGKIIIEGGLKGNRDEVKRTIFSLGFFEEGNFTSLNDAESSVKIISSPFSIHQKVEIDSEKNIVKAGETISFEIVFKNESDMGLRDIIVTEHLEGSALNFATLKFDKGGSYDAEKQEIIWKAAEYDALKNLSAGQEEVIKFSVEVKKDLPINSKENKNFLINSMAKIDSPDVPTPIGVNKVIASNLLSLKVASPVSLETLGYYNDKSISNSGPVPPKVGEETTYSFHWKVSSLSNDLEKTRVEAYLPSGVSFTGIYVPQEEKISYNSRTNKVVWDLGEVLSGTGKLIDAREVAFQVKIKPSVDQVGKVVDLLNESVLSGKDKFVQEDFVLKNSNKTNADLNDENATSQKGRVVQ